MKEEKQRKENMPIQVLNDKGIFETTSMKLYKDVESKNLYEDIKITDVDEKDWIDSEGVLTKTFWSRLSLSGQNYTKEADIIRDKIPNNFANVIDFLDYRSPEFTVRASEIIYHSLFQNIYSKTYFKKIEDKWIECTDKEALKIFNDEITRVISTYITIYDFYPVNEILTNVFYRWNKLNNTKCKNSLITKKYIMDSVMVFVYKNNKSSIDKHIEEFKILKSIKSKNEVDPSDLLKKFLEQRISIIKNEIKDELKKELKGYLSSELFEFFNKWKEEQKISQEITLNKFGRYLKNTGLKSERTRYGQLYYDLQVVEPEYS